MTDIFILIMSIVFHTGRHEAMHIFYNLFSYHNLNGHNANQARLSMNLSTLKWTRTKNLKGL